MTRFAVGALNILCTRMMPCTALWLAIDTKDVYGHKQKFMNTCREIGGFNFYEFGEGTFFTSAKALHFVVEAASHWKGICIYAFYAFGMPFILTFNKLLAALFQP